MRITAISGGIGGACFLTGLLHYLHTDPKLLDAKVTIIGNTGDDITLHGLRICPDLDTVMYTLGQGQGPQGWGRSDETFTIAKELEAYGASDPKWFTLGDRDFATHIIRTRLLGLSYTLTQVTAALSQRWLKPQVRLLPMSDDSIATHVVIEDDQGQRAIHFQQWWVGHQAKLEAKQFVFVGINEATAAPGVIEALTETDIVILVPSNPVVSIGPVLSVPGIRNALRETTAPIVGISPIIAGAAVRGMADICLKTIGVESTAMAVGDLYADFLDGWIVAPGDEKPSDSYQVLPRPILMTDQKTTAQIAKAVIDLATKLGPNQ